jgi:hypothetical protein
VDWSNERYVRLYVRDTTTWKRLGFEGQALFCLLIRKVDRTGILEIDDAEPWEAASLHVNAPEDFARKGMDKLLLTGVFEHVGSSLIVPNFVDAQEASMSTTMRQKEHRLRRRDMARAGLDPSQRETAIYFLQSEHGGEIKIGRADDVAKRIVSLQTSRPDKLVLLAAASGSLQQERDLHDRFSKHRVKGEWFSPVPELVALISDVVERGADAFFPRDESRIVTGHQTSVVTLSRAVPSHSLPANANQTNSARDGSGDAEDSPFVTSGRAAGSGHQQTVLDAFREAWPQGVTMPRLYGEKLRQSVEHCRSVAKTHARELYETAKAVCLAAAPGSPNWDFQIAKVDPFATAPPKATPGLFSRPGRIQPTRPGTEEDFKHVEDIDVQIARSREKAGLTHGSK